MAKTKSKPYIVLATNGSESKPKSPPHEIRLGGDNVLYCTCWAWRMNNESPKTCKHIKRYRACAKSLEALVR